MSAQQALLRGIPKVDDLLLHPTVAAAANPSRAAAADAVRTVLSSLRAEILSGTCTEVPPTDALAVTVCKEIARALTPSLRRTLNATGVVLHTNLGRAPLATCAAAAAYEAARGYSTLEYNVEAGERGSRYSHVVGLLKRLTGAEDALVVNNNAAAVLLALSALARGREVVVSRGELVEIGGSFRVPEVMEQSGCILKEVGTTNKVHLADYEKAAQDEAVGALLKVHTSNYRIIGFTEEVPLADLVAVGRKAGLPVLYDLGSGCLADLRSSGISDEPRVADSVKTGADVVTFSGDKLLGGPQAGIIVGKAEHIAKMKKHPLTRALRIDKMTLAALEATLRLYLDEDRTAAEIPILRMLAATPECLQRKARTLLRLFKKEPFYGQLSVLRTEGPVGGGSVPGRVFPSYAVAIAPGAVSVTELEQRLRLSEPPLVARIAQDTLLLDVRTLDEKDFLTVAGHVAQALQP